MGLRAPTTSTWCSARCTTPRRCGSRPARCWPAAGWCVPGPFDPATVTAAIDERAADHDVLRAGAPAAAVRALGRARRARPVAASGWSRTPARRAPSRSSGGCSSASRDGSTWEFYGSTEGQFTACRSEEWLERPGTLGRARPGRTMSVDEDGTSGASVPPHARFSYFGDPEKTAAAWRETVDGPAFTVGDLGRIDEDGYVYLDGRREDLVISGGVNVYPAEVEQVLGELAGVEDVAVFGVEDEQWGQRVCAAVVGAVDDDALATYAREHLAPAKRPKEYHRLDALPRTPTGKVRRLDLPDLRRRERTDGVLQGRAGGVPRRRGARPAPRAGTSCGCCSWGSTPGCGPRPCRPTSPTRATASTRPCCAPASSPSRSTRRPG